MFGVCIGEYRAERADPGACIDDDQIVSVADLKAAGVAAEADIIGPGDGVGTAGAPKFDIGRRGVHFGEIAVFSFSDCRFLSGKRIGMQFGCEKEFKERIDQVDVERFFQKIIALQLDRALVILDHRMGCCQNDADVVRAGIRLDLAQDLHAVDLGQHQLHEDEVRLERIEFCQTLKPRSRRFKNIAAGAFVLFNQLTDLRIGIGDEDFHFGLVHIRILGCSDI